MHDNNSDIKFKNIYRPKFGRIAHIKLLTKLHWHIFIQELTGIHGTSLLFKKGLSLALIFICVFIGTSAYAYNSEDVIPGNVLYSYKRELENIELKLATDAPAKAAKCSKFTARRIAEAKKLSRTIREDVAKPVIRKRNIYYLSTRNILHEIC